MPDTTILSESEFAEVEARANAATEGPWVYFGEPQDNVFWGEIRSAAENGHFAHITDTPELDERDDDMEFIAHARTDIPALCQTVRAANSEVRALLQSLGKDAVHVRENGGPEDVYASLAVSVTKLVRERDEVRADLEERTEQREVYRERLETEMREHAETESQLAAVTQERDALREQVANQRDEQG